MITEETMPQTATRMRPAGTGLTRRQWLAAGGAALAAGLAAARADTQPTTATETAMTLDPDKTALLLLHYQGDILSIFAQAGIDAYVGRMTALAGQARAAGLPVIFGRIGFSPDYREIHPANQNGQMIRGFGLFTADEVPVGLRAPGDTVLTGHRVSAFKGTALDQDLRARGIDTLLMAGITTSGVVLSTLSEASDLDYRIVLVEDGCFDPDVEAHAALVRTAFATRARIASATEVAAMIG